MKHSCTTFLALALAVSFCCCLSTPVFSYNGSDFLLHGEPFQIIGGQMDPQRIPYQYWKDRLAKVRALGINTIFSYVFWDQLMPSPGDWTLLQDPQNNIVEYFRLAQEEGLHVVLRPGPYVCGEHEWGGFPAWLSVVPNMTVRSNNPAFLAASNDYFQRLSTDLSPLLVNNGGPILMVQIENEYGSYGGDHDYTNAYKSMLEQHFKDAVLYTNDGYGQANLEGGSVPGVLAETDGDAEPAFKGRDQYITAVDQLGPLLDGEYYTLWPDQWGANLPHKSPTEQDVADFKTNLDYALGTRKSSISLYMVHGGTNWGFQNGALWSNKTIAWTTSYDYGSPIDESGRQAFYYNDIRQTIAKHVPANSIPDPPPDIPLMQLPDIPLHPTSQLWSTQPPTHHSQSPLPMESLGQSHGFTLYTHTATSPSTGPLLPGDRPRDRAIIYINATRIGVLDSQYASPPPISLTLHPGDTLSLLIENLGRVNYYSRTTNLTNMMVQPHKGIVGDVTVGGKVLYGWGMECFSVAHGEGSSKGVVGSDASDVPRFYQGTFDVPETVEGRDGAAGRDTFVSVEGGVRGEVWVNGVHLGRYWVVGPQQSLYLPGTVVRERGNVVTVLELEPDAMGEREMVVRGLGERVWFNRADPDCLNCT